jgi:hypothetical protein
LRPWHPPFACSRTTSSRGLHAGRSRTVHGDAGGRHLGAARPRLASLGPAWGSSPVRTDQPFAVRDQMIADDICPPADTTLAQPLSLGECAVIDHPPQGASADVHGRVDLSLADVAGQIGRECWAFRCFCHSAKCNDLVAAGNCDRPMCETVATCETADERLASPNSLISLGGWGWVRTNVGISQ